MVGAWLILCQRPAAAAILRAVWLMIGAGREWLD